MSTYIPLWAVRTILRQLALHHLHLTAVGNHSGTAVLQGA